MKIRIFLVVFVALFLSFALHASWMGVAWLWIRVDKVSKHKTGSTQREVQLKVLHWGKGGGHGNTYGKKFPGRTLKVNMVFPNSFEAARLSVGDTAWVRHRASTSMYYDSSQKKSIGHSSSSWHYLGNKFGKLLLVKKESAPDDFGYDSPLDILYAINKQGYLALKVRYKTHGKHYPEFRLYLAKKNQSQDTLDINLVYNVKNALGSYTNRNEYDHRLIQIDLREFAGKTVRIFSAKKRIGTFIIQFSIP